MNVVFVNARLICPQSGRDARGALRVVDGRIADIAFGAAPDAPEGAGIVDCGGAALGPGLVDLGVTIGEPGAAHLETFASADAAAAAGGVTTIIADPNCRPVCDGAAALQWRRRRAQGHCRVKLAFLGALTKGLAGAEMAELTLMAEAGAAGFADGGEPVANTRTLRRALDYARMVGLPILLHPQEPSLSEGAAATESEFSGRLGLPAAPAMAERIGLERALALAELTGAQVVLDSLSTGDAARALARGQAGAPVVAATTIHHIALNELDIENYRTFFKLSPPLRSEADRAETAQALADGVIAILRSGRSPWDEESKRQPFEAATRGAAGLESFLSVALGLYHQGLMGLPALFDRISYAPARAFGLDCGRLSIGAPADLVMFDPDAPWVLDRFSLRGKGRNTPFDRRRMTGRVLGTWVDGERVFGHGAAQDD